MNVLEWHKFKECVFVLHLNKRYCMGLIHINERSICLILNGLHCGIKSDTPQTWHLFIMFLLNTAKTSSICTESEK